jgi:hypothetical protein
MHASWVPGVGRKVRGRSPVGELIESLSDVDAADVLAGMAEVRNRGLIAARRLEGDIWEVRIDGDRVIYRVLFAEEGSRVEFCWHSRDSRRRLRRRRVRRSNLPSGA